MSNIDFVIVGSGGGGGTIAWLLAKAGYRVTLLEQGARHDTPTRGSSHISQYHDENHYRLRRPDPKRRPRGDYNTFRRTDKDEATPLKGMGGWTGTALGGGSLLWGAWALRPLPIDFKLGDFYKEQNRELEAGYDVPNWPVSFSEFEPYFNVAESILAVSGDRKETVRAVQKSLWYNELSSLPSFGSNKEWTPKFSFPLPPFTETPIGRLFERTSEAAEFDFIPLPTALVNPSASKGYSTRAAMQNALASWGRNRPKFWEQADRVWSRRIRDACNLCGYCGEYVCWGGRMPKSGVVASTLREIEDLADVAEVITDAKAYEVMYDDRTRRASGIRYLDIRNPDQPIPCEIRANQVILSCGAIQTARLLLLSGGPAGLANSSGCVGKYATYHMFGIGAKCVLPENFQGRLHAEFGHTGTQMSYDTYLMKDGGTWRKGGILSSIGKKNPLEAADQAAIKAKNGLDLLKNAELNNRTVEVRFTGDDLPRKDSTVTLDRTHVDEYGLPVACITRPLGPEEQAIDKCLEPEMERLFTPMADLGVDLNDKNQYTYRKTIDYLFGDHQMGTCRMGDDPRTSVVDRHCRSHDIPNLFIVDTSFMPTGFGLNPMVTVVANALRVGTWMVESLRKGVPIDRR